MASGPKSGYRGIEGLKVVTLMRRLFRGVLFHTFMWQKVPRTREERIFLMRTTKKDASIPPNHFPAICPGRTGWGIVMDHDSETAHASTEAGARPVAGRTSVQGSSLCLGHLPGDGQSAPACHRPQARSYRDLQGQVARSAGTSPMSSNVASSTISVCDLRHRS